MLFKFEMFGSDRAFVKCRTYKKILEEFLMPSFKDVEAIVMAWGWFGGGEVGDLYCVTGILIKKGYDSFLHYHALCCEWCFIGANFILQQDNETNAVLNNVRYCQKYTIYRLIASAVTRSQPYWAFAEAAWTNGKQEAPIKAIHQLGDLLGTMSEISSNHYN